MIITMQKKNISRETGLEKNLDLDHSPHYEAILREVRKLRKMVSEL